ncbi:hypothetical protein D5086_027211 [Populus alba]|uniref:Uncharacterized protein n=1 Tax=Populus alba TaxID=43335 RepID=A0ACC4B5J2_POPAL
MRMASKIGENRLHYGWRRSWRGGHGVLLDRGRTSRESPRYSQGRPTTKSLKAEIALGRLKTQRFVL